MSRTTYRLGAFAAAALTALPALPAFAGPPAFAPPVRSMDQACPADRVPDEQFADAAGNVHADAIRCLAWYGVAKGSADGSFGVGREVTREQVASFLARVLEEAGVTLPEAADAFTDDEGSVHEPNLDALAALGIVQGAGDRTVAPEEPLARGQMAALLTRLLEFIGDEELTGDFSDYFADDESSVHEGAINALAGLGIAAGRHEGRFDPGAEVFREQLASFLTRLLDRLVEKGEVGVPATFTLSEEEVVPEQRVTGTVLGDGIVSVQVAGCGIADLPEGDVVDGDGNTEGIQFTFTVPATFPAEEEEIEVVEECELIATVTFEDGEVEELDAELEFAEVEEEEPAEEEDEEETEPADDEETLTA